MSGFDVGDWVIVHVPKVTEGMQEVWGEGEIEKVEDAPLGGKTITVRRPDSIAIDVHENFCTHVRRPQRGL